MVSGLKKDPLKFSKSTKELFRCIENHRLYNAKKLPYKSHGVGKAVASRYAEIFSHTTATRLFIHRQIHFDVSRETIKNDFVRGLVYSKNTCNHFKILTMKVLVDCSDDEDDPDDIHAAGSSKTTGKKIKSKSGLVPTELPFFPN